MKLVLTTSPLKNVRTGVNGSMYTVKTVYTDPLFHEYAKSLIILSQILYGKNYQFLQTGQNAL